MEWARHDVIAFRIVLAANVLHHSDIAALHDYIDGIVVAVQDRSEMRAVSMIRKRIGFVRGPRQQDRRVLGPFWDQNHGVKPHSVAHRNH